MNSKHTNGSAGHPFPAPEAPPIGAPSADARMRKRIEILKAQRDKIQREIDSYEFVIADLFQARAESKRAVVDTVIGKALTHERQRRGRNSDTTTNLADRIGARLAATPDDAPIRARDLSDAAGCSLTAVMPYLKSHGYQRVGTGNLTRWIKPGAAATPSGAASERIADTIAGLSADESIHAADIARRVGCSAALVLQYLNKHRSYRKIGKGAHTRWIKKGARVPALRRTPTMQARDAARKRTLAILNAFTTDEPRPKGNHGPALGILVTSGYLAKRDGGYVRTSKPYEIHPTA